MRIELGLTRNRVHHPAHLQPVYEWGRRSEKGSIKSTKGFVAYSVCIPWMCGWQWNVLHNYVADLAASYFCNNLVPSESQMKCFLFFFTRLVTFIIRHVVLRQDRETSRTQCTEDISQWEISFHPVPGLSASCGAVGWGTTPQDGRFPVRFAVGSLEIPSVRIQ
jgi:hypothetical protein